MNWPGVQAAPGLSPIRPPKKKSLPSGRKVYEMPDYIEYLNLPTAVLAILGGLFLVLQVVGKILEFKGKAAPEFMRITKYIKRKRQERKDTREALALLPEYKKTLEEFRKLYSNDNIQKRNDWMNSVDSKQAQDHEWINRLDKKMDENSAITLEILIENKRSEIISFASYVIDENAPVTREQFNRIFKLHGDYEAILKEHKRTNGETTAAMRIINESYEAHTRNHSFVEDTRWV